MYKNETNIHISARTPVKIMRSCMVYGNEVNHGESLQVDHCTLCFCNDGSIKCSIKDCPRTFCNDPLVFTGECCGLCPYCKYLGIKINFLHTSWIVLKNRAIWKYTTTGLNHSQLAKIKKVHSYHVTDIKFPLVEAVGLKSLIILYQFSWICETWGYFVKKWCFVNNCQIEVQI